jgi:hypothetical protein
VAEPQIIEVVKTALIAPRVRAMFDLYIASCIVIPTSSPGSSGRGVTLLGHCSSLGGAARRGRSLKRSVRRAAVGRRTPSRPNLIRRPCIQRFDCLKRNPPGIVHFGAVA